MIDHLSMLTRFAVGMGLVIWLPRLLECIRLPGVLGYILAGLVLGPGVAGVLNPDSPSIILWAELGKLLFMFFVGFEIDIEQFNRVRGRAAYFGVLTFSVPFALAFSLGLALGMSPVVCALLGSIIASHTLIAYPILTRANLMDRECVLVAVGGTIFTDVVFMIVLALSVSIYQTGFSWSFLFVELVELAVYVPFVLFGLSRIARKLIIRFGDSPEARVAILLFLIAIAAELAHLIRLEGIVGAFLIGMSFKHTLRGKFAVEELEVLAKALFIPCFFLATGFLIDLPLLGQTIVSRPQFVFWLMAALLVGKFTASYVAKRHFGYSANETKLVFSMTIPQMAATLASAVVGYQTKNAQGERMLDVSVVNACLVMVVVTCILGPILTERFSKPLVAEGETETEPSPLTSAPDTQNPA